MNSIERVYQREKKIKEYEEALQYVLDTELSQYNNDAEAMLEDVKNVVMQYYGNQEESE